MKFKKIRKLCAKADPIQILFEEGDYENYLTISDVPDKYNDCKVKGVGAVMIDDLNDLPIQKGLEIYLMCNNRKENE